MSDATTGFNSIFRPDLFAGRRFLITGGGTGIGRCIAHEIASLGGEVILAARREEPLAQTAEEITEAGGVASCYVLNIRDEAAVDDVMARIVSERGPIHGLVNNAGGQFAAPAALIKAKGWRAVIDTNLNGTFFVCQAALKHAMMKHGGAIVSLVADMWNGFPGMAHTGAARAAVVNLTKTLAIEWAPLGVRVNAVAPGYILSSGLLTYPPSVQKMAAEMMPRNPSSRIGTESEVSAGVCYLLSPAASFITGETLRVDGGGSLQKASLVAHVAHEKNAPFDGFHLTPELPEIFRKP